ncbi:EAL domain-containing protein [Modestobacter marinus]|uniref:Bifunctional diguanylate cyclase/phosphodiesterase n=1 Tax=Modestobacter marinus TaxID=477641 RepID=A0A846LRB9_9ACTN|nr:GGDEF domain-containing protein [Modestobacter marinus]NIH66029.1 diguanylate cyclase (GGDEF)-like protein [Modestobacter marinus]GGL69034.1 bifunctional diguanylate cyclase/phosphodiesterase [Modestobacter marinus]
MPGQERWRDVAVALLCAALAAGAIALVTGPLQDESVAVPTFEVPWWALMPLFTATELLVVHLQIRRESISISFAEIPLVLGLAFCDPQGYVLASVLGSAAGLLWHRRLGLELPFNLSLFALEAALAQTLFHALLADGNPTGTTGIVAALVTIVAAHAVSAMALTAVIFLTSGRFDGGVLTEAVTSALFAALANSSVGLLVVVLLVTRPGALVLVLAVVATLALAYRGYSGLSRGHARLESLYRFTDGLGDAVRTDAVVEAVLGQARDVLGAETAEIVVLPGGPAPAMHLRLGSGEVDRLDPGDLPGWWAAAVEGTPVLRRRGTEDPTGPRDGLAAPLRVDDAVVGVLLVTDRPHHLDTFSDTDLRLFTSLANHAGLSLHKAQLVDQLATEAAAQEHRSLHDPLTGLPNRRKFLQLLGARLADHPQTAVVMLDVDGFKDVNDALGHPTGDLLLVEVGRRLAQRLGTEAVARLGNDEFAVLLPAGTGAAGAPALTSALIAALSVPFPFDGVDVDVRLSAGLAQAPDHGDDAATLLQHADTALYAAKQTGQTLSAYDPATDGASARLRMTGDLRDAIAAGLLEVHYQPKVDPVTGDPLGAEALVRWEHPAHGRVSPEEFVPLAEHTGLIRPLTALVLDAALTACAGWRHLGHDLGVAVNLSARSLTDPGLPAQVRAALTAAGLPPDVLTLEITETAVMSDLRRSSGVLRELRGLGVRLSVDDFGTGQSSLAYLKQLPVHEVKIDKSFVMGMADDRADAAIVRATIDLGHALGLRVVAEGVEDLTTQSLLAGWGCDLVQGYHVSRPVPAPALSQWLAARSTSLASHAVPIA